jgi:large subunit ribosomal protein L35Ae
MKATIVNFRSGKSTQKDSHMIIMAEGVDDKKKASAMVGKKVVFKTPAAKEIAGKIAAAHGNKGAMRVIFEKGMPGQSLGKQIDIE